MNKFIIVVLFVGFFTNAQVTFEKSLAITFEKAQTLNKPVFIKYYNSECSVCKKFQTILETDQEVIAFYNANFINYAMNTGDSLDKNEEELIKNANLNFEAVPVAIFFDKNKQFLHYSGVQINSEYIVAIGKMASNPNFRTAALQNRYENGDKTVRTLYAFADYLVVTKNEQLLTKVTQDLFEAFNKEELPTKKSYIVLKNVIHNSDNGFFQYWISNLDKLKDFESGSHEGAEKEVLVGILMKELSDSERKHWPKAKKETYKKYITKLKMTDNPEVFFQ